MSCANSSMKILDEMLVPMVKHTCMLSIMMSMLMFILSLLAVMLMERSMLSLMM